MCLEAQTLHTNLTEAGKETDPTLTRENFSLIDRGVLTGFQRQICLRGFFYWESSLH